MCFNSLRISGLPSTSAAGLVLFPPGRNPTRLVSWTTSPSPACWMRRRRCLRSTPPDPFRVRSYRRAAEAVEQQTTQLATLVRRTESAPCHRRHRQRYGRKYRDLVATGTMPLRDGAARKIPSLHAGAAASAGHGAEDRRSALVRAPDRRYRPARGRRQRQVICSNCPAWDRSSPTSCSRALKIIAGTPHASASIRRWSRQTASQRSFAPSQASRPSRPRAPCVAGARPSAISTCWSPARHASLTSSPQPSSTWRTLPLIDKLLARGAEQGHLHPAQQSSGRRPPAAARKLRRRPTVLHRLQDAQRNAAAASHQAWPHALEYALLRLEDNAIVAAATEEEIYNALGLDYIAPELRENCGELEAAAAHTLP